MLEYRIDSRSFRMNVSEAAEMLAGIKENTMRIRLLENRFGNDIKALYDGYMLVYEKLSEIQDILVPSELAERVSETD